MVLAAWADRDAAIAAAPCRVLGNRRRHYAGDLLIFSDGMDADTIEATSRHSKAASG